MTTSIPAGTWTVDHDRSRVGFEVKHLGFATAKGTFTRFDGRVELSADASDGTVTGSVDVASVQTGEPPRDEYLTGAGFFDAAAHPQITFTSTSVQPRPAGRLAIAGDLTMHGMTRPITLEAEMSAVEGDGERVQIEASGEVRRRDYGLTIEGPSNALIGDKVTITLSISAVRAA
jgi:polyisoprenoid-binding protein YceI